MVEECNTLHAHDENCGRYLHPLDSLKALFADRFRRSAGKALPEVAAHSDVTDDDEQGMRREILQASLRRARDIFEIQQLGQEDRGSDSQEPLSETTQVASGTPQPKLPPDWNVGLRMARSYTSELRKVLFNSCCQLQREASSVDLHELWRVVARLRVAEKREKELTHAADWARSLALANGEQID
jgi:hypothetical protein